MKKTITKVKADMHVSALGRQLDRCRHQPEARVHPTPFSPHRVVMAASRLGSLRNAFRDSVWTARGVLIRTKLVSCG